MNKVIFVIIKQDQMKIIYTFIFAAIATIGFTQDKVNWMSWEDAMKASEKEPKKIYIDLYTDWCGWCKKMDASTFVDPEVVKYMNENFHSIKFNAEQKEDIVFNDHTFSFTASGRRGVHQLAYSLLNGRLGYPSFVILDEEKARILISPGFKDAAGVMMELKFAKEEKYKTTSWENFKAMNTPPRPSAPSPATGAAKANPKPSATKTNVVKTKTTTTTTNSKQVNKPNEKQKLKEESLKSKEKAAIDTKEVDKTTSKATKAKKKSKTKNKNSNAKPVVNNKTEVEEEEIFKVTQEMPRFPGCEEIGVAGQELTKCSHAKMFEYIQSNLEYPKEAKQKKITGIVVVQFVVGKNGALKNISVLNEVGGGCSEAAVAMVEKMPNWVPGKHLGKRVSVQYSLPVRFEL